VRGEINEDSSIGNSSPALVVGDVVIVGPAHEVAMRPPSKANIKGDVRGFDARTGKLLWTFHTIPERGEAGYETWLDGSAEYTGNAGVWAAMAADPELGLVYCAPATIFMARASCASTLKPASGSGTTS
jgi:quinoprotein glucose dehydrogenase